MARIEFITKRIAGKEWDIAKLTAKMERIRKAEASGWEVNPYYYDESDIKRTQRELDEAQAALAKWQAELKTAQEKADSRNVKAILDFLAKWQERMADFYLKRFAQYPEAYRQYEEDLKEFSLGYYEERKLKKEDYEKWREYDSRRKAVKEGFSGAYGFLEGYISRKFNPVTRRYDSWEMDEAKLRADLKYEADRKYDNIIERTNQITGTITDATGLYVGEKGELDGYVIGEKGVAHVHTIGAGGYNIQCFHFRVLVHPVNTRIADKVD